MRVAGTLIALGVFSAVLLGAAACSDGEDTTVGGEATSQETSVEEASVDVSLLEWQVIANVDTVPSGTVTFNAANIGGIAHELVVIQTDLGASELPITAEGGVNLVDQSVTFVGEVEDVSADSSDSITLELEPGAYVLVCNIVDNLDTGTPRSHYQEGMATAFTVTG